MRQFLLLFFLLFISINSFSQRDFVLLNDAKKQNTSFKLLSNLIIFPIEVNGTKMNFILDSGVGATILFNLNPQDSIRLKNTQKKKLLGLGREKPVDAILSTGNTFKFNNIYSNNQKLYVIFNDSFDLSSKLGITIHGIIGYKLFKDFVVKINYSLKKLTFYDSDYYDNKCKKCETFNLQFYKFKPYINIYADIDGNSSKLTPIKLLIDSGGSDAMWLFENSHPDITPPKNYFEDFLGEGLSGTIYGKRSRINSLNIGNFILKEPNVSYPDSLSISHALKFKKRNGSLGGSILRRFVVTFDYTKSQITLKKGGKFNHPFRYNMSGLEVVYNGKMLVKERQKVKSGALGGDSEQNNSNSITFQNSYKYTFKPTYKIQKVSPNSPAALAGIEPNDILIKIEGQYSYDLKLEEIVGKFYQKENTKIKLVIERAGKHYQYSFRLKDLLK